MTEKYSEKNTAYHEAGHIVVHIEKNVVFGGATIVPRYDSEGDCFLAGETIPASPPVNISYTDNAVICLAGPYAEAKLRGCSFLECCDNSEGGDYNQAHKMVEFEYRINFFVNHCMGEQSTETLYQRYKQEAREIVDKRWNWVEAIAQALLEYKELTHDQILKILDDIEEE